MKSKFKKGNRVRGKAGSQYEVKTGEIKAIVDTWLDIRSQRPTEEPKDAMKYFVLWDGEKETTPVKEDGKLQVGYGSENLTRKITKNGMNIIDKPKSRLQNTL